LPPCTLAELGEPPRRQNLFTDLIMLQGDHGRVEFRKVRLTPLI